MGMAGEKILVVEDDELIAASLVRALTAHGYEAQRAANGADALSMFAPFDLVVLDLGLPDMDGVEVCKAIRAVDPILPIVMLTARQDEIDVVIGLDAGAVDYMTKPFGLAEFLARLRAQLRRTDSNTASSIEVGDVIVDPASRRAWHGGVEMELRAKEFDLLVLLTSEAGRAIARDRIMTEVWDEHWFGSTKTLDVHLASLRRKLGEEPGQQSRISTLRGIGYRFELP